MAVIKSIFITGASGFVGRRLVQRLRAEGFPAVTCLTRSDIAGWGETPAPGEVRYVRGDLVQPDLYLPYLRTADALIHLAAATGKAPREECDRVNREGTRCLVEACRMCGVQRFLHVSTIAVKFPDDGTYHYGRSKREGEAAVTGSGLDYAIVRPTIVLGKGSPIWKNLCGLGRQAVAVIPGDGRARIQPVHVDDLVHCLLKVVREDLFCRATYEIGGRDVVTIEDFVRKIHRHYFHKEPGVVHLPMQFIVAPLRLAEKVLGSLLPLNAGQFASFRYDGVVDGNPLFERCLPNLRGVDATIGEIAEPTPGNGHVDPESECRAFCRYLIGRAPDDYVLARYVEATRIRGLSDSGAENRVGRCLLDIGARSPAMTRLADAFAAVFARKSLFRKKLVLLIAILESGRTAGELVRPAVGEGKGRAWLGLFGQGMAFLASLAISVLVIVPLILVSKNGTAGPGR